MRLNKPTVSCVLFKRDSGFVSISWPSDEMHDVKSEVHSRLLEFVRVPDLVYKGEAINPVKDNMLGFSESCPSYLIHRIDTYDP